nr:MAG: hypothetical protein [Bacteriophage sp.]
MIDVEEVLGFINKALEDAGVPYEFLEWTQKVTYPYFVGEYSEFEPDNESGEEDKSFILTGFYRGNNARYELEKMRAKIEATFPAIGGKVAALDSGSVVAVFYGNSSYIPTGEEELYKIQINLSIKLWKVV